MCLRRRATHDVERLRKALMDAEMDMNKLSSAADTMRTKLLDSERGMEKVKMENVTLAAAARRLESMQVIPRW